MDVQRGHVSGTVPLKGAALLVCLSVLVCGIVLPDTSDADTPNAVTYYVWFDSQITTDITVQSGQYVYGWIEAYANNGGSVTGYSEVFPGWGDSAVTEQYGELMVSSDGVFSYTAPVVSSTLDFDIVIAIEVTKSDSTTVTENVTIHTTVCPDSVTITSSDANEDIIAGDSFSRTITTDPAGASLSVTGASWLSIKNSVLSGTPSAVGDYTVTLTAISGSNTDTQTISIHVADRLIFQSVPTNGILAGAVS